MSDENLEIEKNAIHTTSISLPQSVKDAMDSMKIIPREPYYQVILRLIETHKSVTETHTKNKPFRK
jgi:hypothetical protein